MRYDPLDFSPHMINTNKGLRRMRDALLKHQYDEALREIEEIIVQMRLAKAAVTDVKERQR